MSLSSDACRRAAELLLAARRDLTPIPALPGDCRPETPADGYAIQAALRGLRGGEMVGFKIGATNQTIQTLLATEEPFHGCLFADGVHDSPATLPASDTNFRLIEPEFAFRLGADLPARGAPYQRAELIAAVASLHPAFEVVTSAYGEDTTGAGLAQLIADNGVHAHLEHLPTLRGHSMGQSGSFGQARRAARCGSSGKRHNAADEPLRPTEGRVLLSRGRVALLIR